MIAAISCSPDFSVKISSLRSKSAALLGMLGVFIGMRVRLTKKLLPPELVQEATGEVAGIAFHPQEKFGAGHGSSKLRPADEHPCWQVGHVKCDFLPLHVEVRFDDCHEDYTGLGKPGVWHLAPFTVAWMFPQKKPSLWIIPIPQVNVSATTNIHSCMPRARRFL